MKHLIHCYPFTAPATIPVSYTHLQVYIADGHHRAASAVKVGLMRRDAHPDYTGTEEFNYFLSVLFSSDELQIFDYNRVITDLNGYTFTELLTMIEKHFHIQKIGSAPFHPQKKGQFGLYGNGNWYCLEADPCLYSDSPVAVSYTHLDVYKRQVFIFIQNIVEIFKIFCIIIYAQFFR